MLINLIRIVMCIAIGCFVLGAGGEFSNLLISPSALLITVVSGVTTSVFVTTWLLSIRKGAYMLVDVFLMVGVMVTVFCSWVSFGEQVSVREGIGFVVLLIAGLLMCSYQRTLKGKLTLLAVLLLIACGVANGLTDFSQKWFVLTVEDGSVAVFQFYTYIFSALTLLLFYILSGVLEKKPQCQDQSESDTDSRRQKLPIKLLVYVLVMAICLYLNSYFKTRAAALLPASQLYPLNQGCGLLISTAMAAVFFHEKPNAKGIIGVVLAFAALLLINL